MAAQMVSYSTTTRREAESILFLFHRVPGT